MTGEGQSELVARLRSGDETALTELYDATARRAFGLAYRVLGDGAASEDVLQAAYLRLWEQAEQLDEARGSVEGLLMTIVHRRAVDAARARARDRGRTDSLEGRATPVDPPDDQPDAAQRVVQSEDAAAVQAALDELPEPQRRAITLAYFDGLTYPEVADREGVALGTIKSRMRLAMDRLRVRFGTAAR